MKRQALKEDRAEEEYEEDEENYKYLIRRSGSLSSPKPEKSPTKPVSESQPGGITSHFTFIRPILIKNEKQLKTSPQLLCLKVEFHGLVKFILFSVKIQPLTIIKPAIKATHQTDIRVPTLRATTTRRLTPPLLKLRIIRFLDVSVESIKHTEPIKDFGILTPIIKPTGALFQRPILKPSAIRQSSLIHIPRLISKEGVFRPSPADVIESEPGEPFWSRIENVFELFLDEKSGKGIGGVVNYSGEPVYIVLARPHKDVCIETLHYLCIRALREFFGMHPETRSLSSEYAIREIERYLGEKEITIVDEKTLFKNKIPSTIMVISKDGPKYELDLEKLDEEALADRIKDFGKGLRYVIFHIRQDQAKSLYNKLWRIRSKFHDKIFWIEPKVLSIDLKRRLAELMWGFVDIPSSGSYDDLFGEGKVSYYNELEKIGKIVSNKPEMPYPIVKSHTTGPESKEHYLLKKFIAKCLVDNPPEDLKLSKIERKERYKYIGFERKFDEKENVVISDAYVESDGIAIEVETLFEEGKHGGDPIAKIRDITVEKYNQSEIPINRLWIIIENITMLRHLKELWILQNFYERHYKENKINFKVEFFTIDLKNGKFIHIREFMNYVRNLACPNNNG